MNVRKREYFSYGVGSLGKGSVGSFVSLFALIYFTDAVCLPPALAGGIIVAAKILAMIVLPFAGIRMDATNSRFGRFRPYLLWLSPVVGIVTAACFVSPALYGVDVLVGKTLLALCAYLLWELTFNLHDVPFWSLASVVSDDEGKRAAFLSVANVVTTVAGALPVVAVPYLLTRFGNAHGYALSGLIFGLGGGILAITAFFGTRERITIRQSTVSVKDAFRTLFTTKPLLLMDLALLIGATVFTVSEVAVYAGNYLYDAEGGFVLYPGGGRSFLPSELLLTVLVVLVGGGSAIGEAIFPCVFKKAGLKKTFFLFSVVGTLFCVILYFVGYDKLGKASLFILLSYVLVMGVFEGVFESVKVNLIPECTDWSEWRTGVRRDGLFFSVQVTVSQLIESVPVLAIAICLQVCGYVEPVGEELVEQSAAVRDGIFVALTLIPAGGMLLSLLPAAFYRYDGAFRKKVRDELQQRRKEIENGR